MKKIVVTFGLLFYVVLISIGHLTTSISTRLIIIPVRFVSIFGVVICIFLLLKYFTLKSKQGIALFLFFLLTLYGLFLSMVNGGFYVGKDELSVNFFMVTSGILLMSMVDDNRVYDSLAKMVLVYVLIGIFVTVLLGGIDMTFPPHFIFNYAEETLGFAETQYSQGISQFFSIGAIAAAYHIKKIDRRSGQIILIGIVLIFLFLSLLGGARGDSIAALLVVIGYWAYSHLFKFLMSLFIAIFVVFIYFDDISYLFQGIAIFDRLAVFGGNDFGDRDLLLYQVMDLLFQRPSCIITGCGFGYFQKFYHYEYGMSPHNFLAEFIIVFGFPLSLIFTIFVVVGIFIFSKGTQGTHFFILLFIYNLMINMKSGGLFGGWFFTSASMYFAALYLSSLLKKKYHANDKFQGFL